MTVGLVTSCVIRDFTAPCCLGISIYPPQTLGRGQIRFHRETLVPVLDKERLWLVENRKIDEMSQHFVVVVTNKPPRKEKQKRTSKPVPCLFHSPIINGYSERFSPVSLGRIAVSSARRG